MTDTSRTPSGGIKIGTVLSATVSVLGRNFVPFMVLALIIYGVGAVLEIFFDEWIGRSAVQGEFDASSPADYAGLAFATFLASLLEAPVTYGTYHYLRGTPVSLGDSIGRGLALVPVIFGLSLVYTVVLVVGFMLFVIPGILIMVIWWVIIPVAVIERPSFFACFGRSADLIDGSRWPVFLILLIIFIAAVLIEIVVGALAGAVGTFMTLGDSTNLLLAWPVTAVISLLAAVSSAVGYFHLRRAKEGLHIEHIAAVFD